MNNVVELRGIGKTFGSEEVLKDIDLEVKKGEFISFLAPSGSGKTTLLRIINLLEEPSSGEMKIFGRDMNSINKKERLEVRRRMTLVSQKPVMFSGSVFDNISYGLKIRHYSKNDVKEKVKEVLDLVGFAGYEDRNARTLSGGETQRLCFARALIFDPELLLLDEPTTSLDPLSEAKIHNIIKEIKKLGITIILATHKQEEALGLSDRIAVLNEGSLEQVSGVEELFHFPETRFAAEFTGMCNIFYGKVEGKESRETIVEVEGETLSLPFDVSGSEVCFGIRPEEVMILREDVPVNTIHRNIFNGVIIDIYPKNSALKRLTLDTGKIKVFADLPNHAVEKMQLRKGKKVIFSLKLSSIRRLS